MEGPKFVLVILSFVEEHNSYAVALERFLLTDEQLQLIEGSYPSKRTQVSGCNNDGDFVTDEVDENGEPEEPGFGGLRWRKVENVPKFTAEFHCITLQAWVDE